jgi:hypothetical protein
MNGPPPRPAVPTALAPHHLRLFALIVDYLLAVVALKLLQQLLLGESWDLDPVLAEAGVPGAGWLAATAALLLARDLVRGRGPGKWLAGIAVARADDPAAVPGTGALLLRGALLALLPLEAVLVFTNPFGRRLGDRLAGTVVVVPARVPPVGRRLLVLAIVFLAAILAAFLLTAWNLRRSAAYRTAREAAAFHAPLSEALGGPPAFGFSPELELSLSSGGGRARVTLKADGPRGEARVEVSLALMPAPRRWRSEEVRLLEAPPGEPVVRPAPPR